MSVVICKLSVEQTHTGRLLGSQVCSQAFRNALSIQYRHLSAVPLSDSEADGPEADRPGARTQGHSRSYQEHHPNRNGQSTASTSQRQSNPQGSHRWQANAGSQGREETDSNRKGKWWESWKASQHTYRTPRQQDLKSPSFFVPKHHRWLPKQPSASPDQHNRRPPAEPKPWMTPADRRPPWEARDRDQRQRPGWENSDSRRSQAREQPSAPSTTPPQSESQAGGLSGWQRWQPPSQAKQEPRKPDSSSASPRVPQANAAEKPVPKPKPKPVVTEIKLPDTVTVSQLAKLLDVTAQEVEATLVELGEILSSHEEFVSPTHAELVAMSFGKTVTFSQAVLEQNDDAVPRAPVVTIMGHVDHGKTTLLDALRKTSVAAGEAGGITQHIGAFQVNMPNSRGIITFLDTPGHAAFTAMRARGAAVTDVVVLVVAADDGVMPQTQEAIQHAQASGCPIVVALTKCDVPGADPSTAMEQIAKEGLELEPYGGSTPVVQCAAPSGKGLQELEENLLFQAELMELKASQTRPMVGAVVEAKQVTGQGAVVTVIVKRGKLEIGQHIVSGQQWGRVRAMRSDAGQMLKEALPGQPVEVSGLRGMPDAGDDFLVQPSEESARRLSEARVLRKEQIWMAGTDQQAIASSSSSSETEDVEQEGAPKERQLVVLVKADTQGSAEALCASIEALSSAVVTVKAVQAGLGPVSGHDVEMAKSTDARIVGFNVKGASAVVESQAKQHAVQISRHTIIYRLLQQVSEWMAELAPKVEEEVVVGEAAILQTFPFKARRGTDPGSIAGCRVHTGSIATGSSFRVLRAGDVLWSGPCSEIRRHKLEVNQVGKGTECGVKLKGYDDFQPGDVLQCVATELKAQTVEDVVTVLHAGKTQSKNSRHAYAS